MATAFQSGPFHIPLSLVDDEPVGELSPRLAVFSIFDAFADPQIGYSLACLFEHNTPGALAALYAWAAARDLEVEAHDINDTDSRVHRVRLERGTCVEVQARRGVQP